MASRLVESCLRRDGSLFSAERTIWTLDLAQVLDGKVGAPIEGKGSFVDKLERQLEGLEADSVQLAAELLYVQLLAESDTSGDTKVEHINRVLGVAPGTSAVPDELVNALEVQRIEAELRRTDEALRRYFAAFEAGTLVERDCAGRIGELSRRRRGLEAHRDELAVDADEAPEPLTDDEEALQAHVREVTKPATRRRARH